ncbi:MAG: GNAT family N-acetyltransferase [Rhodobacteraceae bacterium]|nr:GNAT family N-acetyltransferase [Paracoccaceae bacterium]
MFDAPSCDTAHLAPRDPCAPSATPCALQQHRRFATALQACGREPVWLDGAPPLLVLRRRLGGVGVAMVSRALMKHPHILADQLRQAGLHRHLILLSPEQPTPELSQIGAVALMTPGFVARIDLTPAQDVRRAGLHQKWRNRLVFGEGSGLLVKRQNLPLKADHWLLVADTLQQSNRGYRNWPVALTLAYARQNPSSAKLFTAFEGREAVAAMLFLRHGTGATYHIGHITARGRALCAHNLLLWQATGWLAAQGHMSVELGLIDTRNAPGLARFKLGAGAKAHKLGGTWGWWPPMGQILRPLARLDRRHM